MAEYRLDDLIIKYSEPSIQTFQCDSFAKSMRDVLYFYYSIEVIRRITPMERCEEDLYCDFTEEECTKCEYNPSKNGDEFEYVLEAWVHDFPKVQYVAEAIDSLINSDCSLVLEDYTDGAFHRIVKYNQIKLEDMCNCEYWYKFERYDYSVKQASDKEYKNWSEYTLTIGVGYDDFSCSSKKDYGSSVYIDKLEKDELLKFKKVTEDFCKESIDIYNKHLDETTIECPKCKNNINLYRYRLKDKLDCDDIYFRCPKCNEVFSDEEDDFYDKLIRPDFE